MFNQNMLFWELSFFCILNLLTKTSKTMKQLISFLAIILASFSLLSCGASKSYVSQADYSRSVPGNFVAGTDGMAPELKQEEIQKKIIYSANLALVVKNPDTVNNQIKDIAKKYEGYVSKIGTSYSMIRVKSDHLQAAIKDISALGKVRSKSLSGEDVTDSYLDFRIRLENAEKARDRYLELLAKAENVEAALLVEKELERLNTTIDMLKGKMNRIDHLAAYSTITIDLEEKVKIGIVGYVFYGLYHGVKWLFVRS
jgi:hypothetical protein